MCVGLTPHFEENRVAVRREGQRIVAVGIELRRPALPPLALQNHPSPPMRCCTGSSKIHTPIAGLQ